MRVAAVPAWAWLAGLVALSTLFHYALGRRMVAPWIMVDELIYSELAKSFADSGRFLLRDEHAGVYGFVYPVLISPAYRLFESVPDAYAAAKAINALVMSLAGVPAYLLARRLLPPALALLGATLALAIPSLVYTGTLMTENAFYPVFLLVALALVRALEQPTIARSLLLVALCGLAFATRAQAVALVPAVLTAPLLLSRLAGRGWRGVAAYRALYGVFAATLLALAALQLARGSSLASLLGAYRVVGEHDYQLGAVSRWFLYHVAELDLYLGVAPFAALLVLAAVARGLPREAQAFVAGALALSFWLVLVVAAFASLPSVQRVEERNMFYAAPLFLIALLVWIERGAPRPARASAIAAVLAAALPGVLPYTRLIDVPAISDTLMLLPWWTLQDTVITLEQVTAVAVLAAVAVAVLMLVLPARLTLVLPALVLAYFALALHPIEAGAHGVRRASVGALFSGITHPRRDWVDRAVPRGAEAAVLWTGKTAEYSIWENEFFSRRVGPVYYLQDPLPGGLPQTRLAVDPRSGLMRDPRGRPVRARYLLTDGSVTPAGRPIASDARKGLTLYRISGPLVSTSRVTGLYPNDTWSGRRVTYTRLSCRGGQVTVGLRSDPGLFRAPQTVVAQVGGRAVAKARVRPSAERQLVVPLEPRRGRCDVTFTVRPTAIPALVVEGSTDTRELGVHFSSFRYSAR